ncbi:hypothetical protein T484DRAFT_1624508, partial [Baffinella frigidus]
RNPKPETRNPKPETRNLTPETRNPTPCTLNYKHDTRNMKHEIRHPKPETRNLKPETRNPNPDTRNPNFPSTNRGPTRARPSTIPCTSACQRFIDGFSSSINGFPVHKWLFPPPQTALPLSINGRFHQWTFPINGRFP